MKRVALIHTVQPVLQTFGEQLQKRLDFPIAVHNILDDFLASDPAETGVFSADNKKRLFLDIQSAQLTQADVIVVTCSTMTPAVELIRPFISTPLIAVDDAMARKAVTLGKNIFILATALSTIEPTTQKLEMEASKLGIPVTLRSTDLKEAYTAMKEGDLQRHDQLVKKRAASISDADVVVLAQASMAHLREDIEQICGVPVLASPELCMQEIEQLLRRTE